MKGFFISIFIGSCTFICYKKIKSIIQRDRRACWTFIWHPKKECGGRHANRDPLSKKFQGITMVTSYKGKVTIKIKDRQLHKKSATIVFSSFLDNDLRRYWVNFNERAAFVDTSSVLSQVCEFFLVAIASFNFINSPNSPLMEVTWRRCAVQNE